MSKNKTKTIGFFNFKGGVGKTTTSALMAYTMATRFDKKILLIDLDPQANLTEMMLKTRASYATINNSLMNIFLNKGDIKDTIIHIIDGVDLIAGQADFSLYSRFLEREFDTDQERVAFLYNELKLIKDSGEYDLIILDTPPTLSLANDTAYYACDYISIVLQTQIMSLQGAETLIDYLTQNIVEKYGSKVDIIEILPVLTQKISKTEAEVLEEARKMFGDYVSNHPITLQERIKKMAVTGITDSPKDMHDKRVYKYLVPAAEEILDRIDKEGKDK